MKIYVYTDGASRGNPGVSASGYCILDESHKQICLNAFSNGVCTNNAAEYSAVIAALKKVLDLFGEEVEVVLASDSSVVINQLAGSYKTKSPNLKKFNDEASKLVRRFRGHRLLNVRRENKYVSLVDRELNLFLDRN